MAGCGGPVDGAGWASWAWGGGFRCPRRVGDLRSDVPKPSTHAGRGEPAWRNGSFPRTAQIGGDVAGEAELGVGGDDQPGPAVGGGRVAQPGCGPAQSLFEQTEGVFQVESA